MLEIYGLAFSAHTRKVILAAHEKGIPFDLVPTLPLQPPAGWHERSPLGLIPVIEDGGPPLADSSVICQYLERTRPQPALYPADPQLYARALWIEEFVDSGLAPHVLRGLLMQRVFAPRFLNQPTDEALVQRSLTELIPPRFAYLDATLDGPSFVGDSFSIADIAVASILINFHYAGEQLDAARYPRLHRWFHRTLTRDCFRKAFAVEQPAAAALGGLDLRLFTARD